MAVTTGVVGTMATGISAAGLLRNVDLLMARYPIEGLAFASGFEDRPELLSLLAGRCPVFGNGATAVSACKDPMRLQNVALAAGIPVPEIRTRPPESLSGWLVKQRGGSGGMHVRHAIGSVLAEGDYWQRQIDGNDYSLTFLAYKGHVVPLGFNACWLAPCAAWPFRYGGAVSLQAREVPCADEVTAAANVLARAFELRGLCGLDFKVATPEQWYLLEINPRPTATFELHESPTGRFRDHLASCRNGQAMPEPSVSNGVCAHTVVYVGNDVTIAAAEFAEWVTDIPPVGQRLSAGAPLCLVHAEGATRMATQSLLAARAAAVVKQCVRRSAPEFHDVIYERRNMNDKQQSIAGPSVNALTGPMVQALIADKDSLRLAVDKLTCGTVVVDAGINAIGGLEAGRRIAEICMGGLGRVQLRAASVFKNWAWHLDVHSTNPVLACLASQYAGWSLSHGKGKGAFNALGSGPARAMGSKEDLFAELGYRDNGASACMVIEVDQLPPVEIAEKISEQCNIKPEQLTLILTPTSSLAGGTQVVARSLEVALHKVHALHFPLSAVIDGAATAPICPPAKDFMTAMGRTNDAILFGGHVQLFVDCTDDDARDLAEKLPSSSSKDYGKPFAQVFKAYNYNFYDIDPMLFSPARVAVTTMKSGKTYHGGRLNEELLELSFGS